MAASTLLVRAAAFTACVWEQPQPATMRPMNSLGGGGGRALAPARPEPSLSLPPSPGSPSSDSVKSTVVPVPGKEIVVVGRTGRGREAPDAAAADAAGGGDAGTLPTVTLTAAPFASDANVPRVTAVPPTAHTRTRVCGHPSALPAGATNRLWR